MSERFRAQLLSEKLTTYLMRVCPLLSASDTAAPAAWVGSNAFFRCAHTRYAAAAAKLAWQERQWSRLTSTHRRAVPKGSRLPLLDGSAARGTSKWERPRSQPPQARCDGGSPARSRSTGYRAR